MLKQALITAVIVFLALMSRGAGPVSASGPDGRSPGQIPAGPSVPVEAVSDPGEGEEFKEEFHQTYPLSATGRVSIENLNGEVQVKVWDRAAVQLDAVKRAYRKERLAEAKIEVNSSEENIRIKTEYPDWDQTFRSDEKRNDNPAIVDYVLTVPRKATLESVELVNGALDIEGVEGSVKASSINGRVNARGLVGEAKLSTINGQLQATFTRLEESKSIYLQSVNGSVTLVIPSDSNASVRASTVHGGISNDFGLTVKHGEYVGHDLDGQIGTGGPRIKLANVNGAIRITHAQDGRAVSPATSRVTSSEPEAREAIAANVAEQVAEATAGIATEAAARAARVDSARIAREAQLEARRQVDVELRQAQREVARAQAQIQRETEREVREQIRVTNSRGRGVGIGAGEGYGGRFTSQESKSFSVTGTPTVNLSTFDGSITIHAWDKPQVMFTATKRADEEADLKNIGIESSQVGSTVSITARSDESNGSALFDVFVPRRASLHITADDGRLSVDGVAGDITLRTGDGQIDVTNGGGVLNLNTGDGRIRVATFEGEIDARTGDGSISLDGNFSALSAKTGDGTISLTVPSGSNFTVETNVENEVNNEGLTMTEDISPSRRVKRWKIGNGGRVFVLHSGDGGIFLRSH